MKIRHKKTIVSAAAVVMAGIIGAGAFLQSTQVAVLASSDMLPGIETIVNETSAAEPFRILEIVDTSSDAEIGYYVSGQEPGLKLYQYTPEGSDTPISFSSVQEALAALPTLELRKAFMENLAEDASGNRLFCDITGVSAEGDAKISDVPLTYSAYTERYDLDENDQSGDWTRVDLSESRTETLTGHFEENAEGTGNYDADFYVISQSADENGNITREDTGDSLLYRENIKSFSLLADGESQAPYMLVFEEVPNGDVNNSINGYQDAQSGESWSKEEIAAEYDYAAGKFGYYENVYGNLTTEIAEDISAKIFHFPGESLDLSWNDQEGVLLIQNSIDAESALTDDDGTAAALQSIGDGTVDIADEEPAASDSVFSSGTGESADAAAEAVSENSDAQAEDDPEAAGTEVFSDSFSSGSDAGTTQEQSTDVIDMAVEEVTEAASESLTEVLTESVSEYASDTAADTGVRYDPNKTADADKAGTQEDPYVYRAIEISAYPYYKYEFAGDLEYVIKCADEQEAVRSAKESSGEAYTPENGAITREDGQYWIYVSSEDGQTVQREALCIVTGRQAVSYETVSDSKNLIDDSLDYNYYFRVKEVWFCVKKQTAGEDSENVNFGWYNAQVPGDGEQYLTWEEGSDSVYLAPTHAVADNAYTLTPGKGKYDFVQGETEGTDREYQVEIDHFYYKGGYTNNDWLKRYVFHLTLSEEEGESSAFDSFQIDVTTLSVEQFESLYDGSSGGLYITSWEKDAQPVWDESGAETVETESEEGLVDAADSDSSDSASGTVSSITSLPAEQLPEETRSRSLADYDLIYVNGCLLAGSIRNLIQSGVPSVFNQGKLQSESGAVMNAELENLGLLKNAEEDADQHYVNGRYYFFWNTEQADDWQDGTDSSPLLNLAFHSNFNPAPDEAETSNLTDARQGFEEILRYINSENQYRALTASSGSTAGTETLTSELSQARAIEYILNYQYRRLTARESVSILEIQPAAAASAEGLLTETQVLKWLGYDTETVQADDEEASAAVLDDGMEAEEDDTALVSSESAEAAVFSSGEEITVPAITITSVTASEFAGHIEDIGASYDLIYVGAAKPADTPSLAERQMTTGSGTLLYSHVGAGASAVSGSFTSRLLGQLDSEWLLDEAGERTNNLADASAWVSSETLSGGGFFRGSGNDMTLQQCEELQDFAKSGYPVVIADKLVNSTDNAVNTAYVDSASYYYDFLQTALTDYSENTMTEEELNTGEKNLSCLGSLEKPKIVFADKPVEPQRLNEETSTEYGYLTDSVLRYEFSVENETGDVSSESTYDCKLYLDLNSDGKMSESEDQDASIQIQDADGTVLTKVTGDGTSHYELMPGESYTLTRTIPSDYYKLITWKLEVSSNQNPEIHTSAAGYTKQQRPSGSSAQTVRILQIHSSNSQAAWNLQSEMENPESLLYQKLAEAESTGDYDFEADTITTAVLENYTSQDAFLEELMRYDILVIGFGNFYSDIPNDNGQADAILAYIRTGKSVIFAHDTTSYQNYVYDNLGPESKGIGVRDDYLADTVGNPSWGYSLNTVLRYALGMDRYGITSDFTLSSGNTIGSVLKKGNSLTSASADSDSVSFATLLQEAGDIAYAANQGKSVSYGQTQAYTNSVTAGIDSGKDRLTTAAAKVNDGAVTQYPYRLGSTITTSETHAQYYQLALEKDRGNTGISDGQTDIVVWYCLSGGTYDASPKDVRNNYYCYSNGNVIYIGLGHSASGITEDETELFVNVLSAAAGATVSQPEVKFISALNPSLEDEEKVRFYSTDQSFWSSDSESNVLETEMSFYIRIQENNSISQTLDGESQSRNMQVEFYMEAEDGDDLSGKTTVTYAGKTLVKLEELSELSVYQGENISGIDGTFTVSGNNAYGITLTSPEDYVRNKQSADGAYRQNLKLYVRVTSAGSFYGNDAQVSSWASITLKQRQLFDLD